MACAGHVIYYTPYVGICEYAASKIVRRLLGSSSSKIGPSVSQVMLSIASEVDLRFRRKQCCRGYVDDVQSISWPSANLAAVV